MTRKPYPRALKKELRDAIVNQSRSAQQSCRPVEVPSTIADVPSFDALPEYNQTSVMELAGETLGIANPYFRTHDGLATTTTVIDGKVVLNFSSYDYLGLNADPRPAKAACEAIERYGVSAAASRMVAGDRPVHRDLEAALARICGVEDALVFVSGHATNVSLIGALMSPGDLILHDSYAHNSIFVGTQLSGATRRSFPHDDLDALEQILRHHRAGHSRVLVVVEGLYSMDGDLCDLPRLIALRQKYGFWLMVDEAHALGALGSTGLGSAEHFGIDPNDVDIWMGTLSKALASTGGYVAGSASLIKFLKHHAAGFVYSVALSPALAASALRSIELMLNEPQRAARLRENATYFQEVADSLGLDTGLAEGSAVMPIMLGDSATAVKMSERLLELGVNVAPVTFPGVPMNKARLRFFLTAIHEKSQIDTALAAVRRALDELEDEGFGEAVAEAVAQFARNFES